jgi:hypothetical protein
LPPKSTLSLANIFRYLIKNGIFSQVPMAQATCYPSYSGGRDQEDYSLKPRQIVCETLSGKTHHIKKRASGVAQSVDPEFKFPYHKKMEQIF